MGQIWDKCQTGKLLNKVSAERENVWRSSDPLTMRRENVSHRAAGSHVFPRQQTGRHIFQLYNMKMNNHVNMLRQHVAA